MGVPQTVSQTARPEKINAKHKNGGRHQQKTKKYIKIHKKNKKYKTSTPKNENKQSTQKMKRKKNRFLHTSFLSWHQFVIRQALRL